MAGGTLSLSLVAGNPLSIPASRAEGLDWLGKPELLTDDELVRLVGVLASMGARTVRLTGGEPLLRRGLPGLVARLAALDVALSLTTRSIVRPRQHTGAGSAVAVAWRSAQTP